MAALELAPKTQIKHTQEFNPYNFTHMNLQKIVDNLNNKHLFNHVKNKNNNNDEYVTHQKNKTTIDSISDNNNDD